MSRSRKLQLGLLIGVLAAGFAVWWFVFRDTAPPAPTLEGAVADVTSTTGVAGSTAEGVEGEWTLSGDGTSFVGYRVREELASIGAKTAVGRTPLVAASLTIEGGAVTAVTVDADLTGLESDDSRRDGAIRRQALETSEFPEAGFVLTTAIPLPAGAAGGEAFEVAGTGDLTLHGVTRSIEVSLQAQLVEGRIVVVGSAPVLFADFDIDKPSAAIVLSVEDNGLLELQLVFERVG